MNLTIEFFHDVVCSYCFPISYRMRQIAARFPNAKIIHRSFALAKTPDDLVRMFGSHEGAKKEIVEHWVHANENDDLHRFCIEGMQKTSFLFPTSMNPLLACKAAYLVADKNQEEAYWNVFDALQEALFVHNQNIADAKIIEEAIQKALAISEISLEKWQQIWQTEESKNAVEADLALAEKYGIHGVPCLVINGQRRVNGAYQTERIIQILEAEMAQLKK